jgi:hypothetical protein
MRKVYELFIVGAILAMLIFHTNSEAIDNRKFISYTATYYGTISTQYQLSVGELTENGMKQERENKNNEPEIDNGILTLKLDLTRGGAICWISLSGSERNIVNIADEGRYIQQSYYAGKSLDRKDEGQSPGWSPWAWNPIQVGDAFRNRAKILDFRKEGNEMYVKCIPMLWDMNNRPAEAEMEQWTTLQGSVLKVRNQE